MTTTDFSKRPEVTVETMVSGSDMKMLPDKNRRGAGAECIHPVPSAIDCGIYVGPPYMR